MQTRQHQTSKTKQTKSLTGVNEHIRKKEIQFSVTGEKWPFESNCKDMPIMWFNTSNLYVPKHNWVTPESFARVGG